MKVELDSQESVSFAIWIFLYSCSNISKYSIRYDVLANTLISKGALTYTCSASVFWMKIETLLSNLISHILNFREQKVKLFFRNTISDHNTFSLRRIFVFFFYRSVEPSIRPPLHRVIRGTSLHQPFFWLIERFVNPLQCKLSTQTKVRLSN